VNGLVDIHSHVLPGIDDGPADVDGAIAMARAAAQAGIETLAATPHLRSDFPDVHVHELTERCQTLQRAIDAEGITLALVSAAEISLVWALEATSEELVLASYGQLGTDLLIETPLTVGGLDQHLYHLRRKGFRITLAHPERNVEFQNHEHQLDELVRQGVLLQVNAESLIGSGRMSNSRRFAQRLCSDGLVHVLASDGHRAASWRPVTMLEQGAVAAAELVGEERAAWMVRDTPAAIVDGSQLSDPPEIVSSPRRKWLFGRWH